MWTWTFALIDASSAARGELPLFWALETSLVGWVAGLRWALAFFRSLPLGGLIAYRYLVGTGRLRHQLGFGALLLTRAQEARRLLAERREIVEELERAKRDYLGRRERTERLNRRWLPSNHAEMPKRLLDRLTLFGRAWLDVTIPTGSVRATQRRYAVNLLDMSDPPRFRDEAVVMLHELLNLGVRGHFMPSTIVPSCVMGPMMLA
jgi:hypothetical protein